MKYQEYLTQLNKLFELNHQLIQIYNNEITLVADKLYDKIGKNYEFYDYWITFYKLDYFYFDRLESKLEKVDQSKLSIKKALLITKNLVDTDFAKILCLKNIKKELNEKIKNTLLVKNLTKGLNHFMTGYLQLRKLAEQLNLNYNDDLSNMTFGLNLIEDKSIDLIDFNKLLISNDWIKLLNDY